MQDLEFTVERGKLYLLQTRNGKRTGAAAVRIAVDMVDEGLITEQEALLRVSPERARPAAAPDDRSRRATGTRAGHRPARLARAPRPARSVFDARRGVEWAQRRRGRRSSCARRPSPEDFHGMVAAKGILTARGGMTTHAAVVARGMGKCCVVGRQGRSTWTTPRRMFRANGTRRQARATGSRSTARPGRVHRRARCTSGRADACPTSFAHVHGVGRRDAAASRCATNADTPHDARRAREFGAEGIGLAAPSTCSSRATASRRCAR